MSLDEHRLVVNLSPGDVRKAGTAFDLAIAVAALSAVGLLPDEALAGTLLLGELSLSGSLRPATGILPQLLHARSLGISHVIVPRQNGAEAAAVTGLCAHVADTLTEVMDHLKSLRELDKAAPAAPAVAKLASVDLAEVRGQSGARRAIEIAAAGHHHLLFMGPPGGGKTMLARRLPTVLPVLSEEEALEVSAIHSVAGLLPSSAGLLRERPFRAPHHTTSDAGLVGGGYPPRPGELSLAHHGVLFLDELPEFRRSALEALRQPLEDGSLVIARARSRATFPARPLLLAASNPCPCGYLHDGTDRCTCSPERVKAYAARLSGPLIDRLDLHVRLPPVAISALSGASRAESSGAVRERVVAARGRQAERRRRLGFASLTNASLSPAELEAVCRLDAAGDALLQKSASELGLSARAFSKVRKVARTIADLAGDEDVRAQHVAEAIQYRVLDRRPGSQRSPIRGVA